MFELHPQLAADTLPVAHWPLCKVLLMNDTRFPWLILVPARAAIREVRDLPAEEQDVLWQEIRKASTGLEAATGAEKMNIAMLGNMVPQLHVHVIARFQNDAAWPKPVWGVGQAQPYPEAESKKRITEFLQCASNL